MLLILLVLGVMLMERFTSYTWRKISGPSSGTIENANADSTAVKDLTEGFYQFQLTVTDDKGASGYNIGQRLL